MARLISRGHNASLDGNGSTRARRLAGATTGAAFGNDAWLRHLSDLVAKVDRASLAGILAAMADNALASQATLIYHGQLVPRRFLARTEYGLGTGIDTGSAKAATAPTEIQHREACLIGQQDSLRAGSDAGAAFRAGRGKATAIGPGRTIYILAAAAQESAALRIKFWAEAGRGHTDIQPAGGPAIIWYIQTAKP
nr:hypothetical protein [Ferrovibrio sp.]